MKKTNSLLLALYELGRLLFFLSIHINLSMHQPPFGWYVSAPLFCTPFLLIYTMYSAHKNSHSEENEKSITNTCLFIFVIQKIASTTGFTFFIVTYIQNIAHNVSIDGGYLLENIIWIVIFFTIDVILSFILLYKNNSKENTSEG